MNVGFLLFSFFNSWNTDVSLGCCMLIKYFHRIYSSIYDESVSDYLSNVLFSNIFALDYYVALW